jgi:hypothetical protein
LNKKDVEKWMMSELSGYSEDIPWYRIVSCRARAHIFIKKIKSPDHEIEKSIYQ